jgi:hypothetical protein
MREININKRDCIAGIVLFGGFSVFWAYLIITGYIGDKELFKKMLWLSLLGIFLLLSIKIFLECLVSFLRFYNLRIEILRDKLILRTDTKECEIPMTKDTTVVCCMDGWLIVWPSQISNGKILLSRFLLGNDFLELCFYFRENTHYIPSLGIIDRVKGVIEHTSDLDYYQPNADYEAAEEEKNELLRSLKIHGWRLKYIRWPA